MSTSGSADGRPVTRCVCGYGSHCVPGKAPEMTLGGRPGRHDWTQLQSRGLRTESRTASRSMARTDLQACAQGHRQVCLLSNLWINRTVPGSSRLSGSGSWPQGSLRTCSWFKVSGSTFGGTEDRLSH